ncbi:MAG: methylated-DNA--[protein]-cysteine S-methyltransferase [Agarilytica sp.]
MNKDYERVALAIAYINQHADKQPSLDDVAKHIHLSPYHFQRLFVQYSGVSPKQFLQTLTVQNAKQWLNQTNSVSEAALASGLSGSSRLHDHFITIEAITPGEYKSQGKGVTFHWGTASTEFGEAYVAWTSKGIHRLEFLDNHNTPLTIDTLRNKWPQAKIQQDNQYAEKILQKVFSDTHEPMRLWVSGTNFQIKVWQALLTISSGELYSYKAIATRIEQPKASRAVGTAIAQNPIAWLIPCHRVIQSSGVLGGYRWNPERKHILLTKELLDRTGFK